MRITGTTKVFLIAGDPVDQVRAPEVFNHVFEKFAIDAVLVPMHVGIEHLGPLFRAAFKARNVHGAFLAIPHKAGVLEHVDVPGPIARAAGAANAVRRDAQGRLEAEMFDGEGFLGALSHHGIVYRDRKVLVIGAGGAASAIGASLAAARAHAVGFYDPVPGKAETLAARIRQHFPCDVRAVGTNDPAGYDLVVNASPLGLQAGDPLAFDVARLERDAAVVDILMKNQPTPLLRAVRATGRVAEPGFEMLIQQTPHYLDYFGFTEAAEAIRRDASSIRAIFAAPPG